MIQEIEEKANSFTLTLYGQDNTRDETAIKLSKKPSSIKVEKATEIQEKWIGSGRRCTYSMNMALNR